MFPGYEAKVASTDGTGSDRSIYEDPTRMEYPAGAEPVPMRWRGSSSVENPQTLEAPRDWSIGAA
ncbi:MAG: hypothetical protein ABJ118_06885 [Luteolibacter sp.]